MTAIFNTRFGKIKVYYIDGLILKIELLDFKQSDVKFSIEELELDNKTIQSIASDFREYFDNGKEISFYKNLAYCIGITAHSTFSYKI